MSLINDKDSILYYENTDNQIKRNFHYKENDFHYNIDLEELNNVIDGINMFLKDEIRRIEEIIDDPNTSIDDRNYYLDSLDRYYKW